MHLQLARHFIADTTQYGMSSGDAKEDRGVVIYVATKHIFFFYCEAKHHTCFVLQYDYARLIHAEHVVNDVLAIHMRRV